MRKLIDIVEGLNGGTGLETRKSVLDAIFLHIKQQVDSTMTRAEFNGTYREFISHLSFPLKIYRALSFEEVDYYNAHSDALDDHEEAEAVRAGIAKIDFTKIGVCWTFDRSAAFSGGALGGGAFNHDGAHVILEATISMKQCDLLTTLYHNLTVYQEEKEVRLWGNMPLTITGMTPNPGVDLPIKANTGPEGYYDRQSVISDLVMAMRNK